MASDEPSYQSLPTSVAWQDQAMEIRLYESVLIASVRVKGASWREASSYAFQPLANYIFGGNERGEKIGMTTPVTTHQIGDEADKLWEVRFFMPPRYEMETLPVPQSPYVSLYKAEAAKFAVIRFSGAAQNQAGQENFARHEAKLRKAMSAADMATDGAAHYAVYNGPWTPNIMRRNEVLIALD
ncbi:MAG: SOUL family heme-binding protein [Candidatus Puniceispirillaceae bacterium]